MSVPVVAEIREQKVSMVIKREKPYEKCKKWTTCQFSRENMVVCLF